MSAKVAFPRHAAARLAVLVLAGCHSGGSSGPDRVAVTPAGVLLTAVGDTRALTAVVFQQGVPAKAGVTWTSSAPSSVSVDAQGHIKALSAVGSAQIFAQTANGTRSPPVLVMVAQTRSGTVLVTDAQVVEVGQALDLAPGEAPGVGSQYEVKLRGVTAPAAGQILLASEMAPVSGRVVSTREESGLVIARLEALALPDLFSRYDIDWDVDTTPYDVVMSDPTARPQGSRWLSSERPARLEGGFIRGVLTCSGAAETLVPKRTIELSQDAKPRLVIKTSKTDEGAPPGYTRVELVGDLALKGTIGIKAEAGFSAEAQCSLTGPRIPIPVLGALSVALSPAIPLGLGAQISGKLVLASLELGLEGRIGTTLDIGFECAQDAPCTAIASASPILELKPQVTVPSRDPNMKVELALGVYLISGLDMLFGGTIPLNMVAATFGPKQSADLAFPETQAADEGYASEYKLALQAKFGPGAEIKRLVELATKKNWDVTFDITLSHDLATSPTGGMTVDRVTAPKDNPVNFTVDLDPDTLSYLLVDYNVDSIEIYRRRPAQPGPYTHVASIPAAARQTRFKWQWTPKTEDLGKNEFTAFVKTKLPVIELEVTKDSKVTVDVMGDGQIKVAATGYRMQTFSYPNGGGSEETTVDLLYDLRLTGDSAVTRGPPYYGFYQLVPQSYAGTVDHVGRKTMSDICDPCLPLGNFTENDQYKANMTASPVAGATGFIPVSLYVPAQSATGKLLLPLPAITLAGKADGSVDRKGCGDDHSATFSDPPAIGAIVLPSGGVDIPIPDPSKAGRLKGVLNFTGSVPFSYPSSQTEATTASWTVPIDIAIEYDLPYNLIGAKPGRRAPTLLDKLVAASLAPTSLEPERHAIGWQQEPVYSSRGPTAPRRSAITRGTACLGR